MTDMERALAAKQFAEYWDGKGYEKGESQPFWMSLLQKVYGVAEPEKYITFEEQVHIDHTSFVDGHIHATHVLIEQKSVDKNLNTPIRQSDGTKLNPFEQAKRYSAELGYYDRPRWIITCNFRQFYIYDMANPHGEPEILELKNLDKEYWRLNILVDTGDENVKKEMEVSLQAGELVGVLYDALLKQYKDPDSEETLKSLNALCVRLVFCLYAEDAGIFGGHAMFHNYLQAHRKQARQALIDLFRILNQEPEIRDPYMDDDLLAFPYVNGGLFADENIVIPKLDEEIIDLILNKASADFDWSSISPTIFGAVFESTLNPETRRNGGMHYTSIENIHKVIDPLFLDDLKQEFTEIVEISVEKTRQSKLTAFQRKLAGLKFLDPACGSGNFLTETYLSLRRLENEVISEQQRGQIMLGEYHNPIQVSIEQFYGIEINDFAVTVAKTALWIAESQMMKETEAIIRMNLDFLPLKTNAFIIEGNALRKNWEDVVPKSELNFIMGNPPFVGASMMEKCQKDDAVAVFGKGARVNSIDYVGAWYHQAALFMQGTKIRSALVSTNSITQGEQVAPLWGKLLNEYHVHIDFAYRTFRWDSEAKLKAQVHCVIIGFSVAENPKAPRLYTSDRMQEVTNISPYLIDAQNILIENRSKPICDVPIMYLGNKPADGGNLILSAEEREEILQREPKLEKYIHPYTGAEEYINGKMRFCFWLEDVSPVDIRQSPELKKRISAVQEMRLRSTAAPTRAKASTPHLFFFISQPKTNYLLIPSTSSQYRKYIPIGFLPPDIIASNSTTILPDATLYHFGVLTSNVHMAWMRAFAGRLKSDYRYSNSVVYNTFPWPNATKEQKALIERTAQGILDARAQYADATLADLYDPVAMLSAKKLLQAHQANDIAVMQAYGFWGKLNNESACVAALMEMYQKLTKEQS